MSPRDQIQLAAELSLAQSQLAEAIAGLQRFTDLAQIHSGATTDRSRANLARYHLKEAAELIASLTPNVGCSGTLLSPAPEPTATAEEIKAPAADDSSSCEEGTNAEGQGAGESLSDSALSTQHSALSNQ